VRCVWCVWCEVSVRCVVCSWCEMFVRGVGVRGVRCLRGVVSA
jgi:hypothetical protein